jgi:hypothetical protein
LPFLLRPTFGIAEVESLSHVIEEALEEHPDDAKNKRKPRRRTSSVTNTNSDEKR